MKRMGIVLAVGLPLAALDLWVKVIEPTPPWAYHERSLSWLVLSVMLLAGLVLVVRIPSALVPPAAGALAGGLLGNALSAAANGMEVPNPLVLAGSRVVLAFNLADVWALAGIALLSISIGLWLVRSRALLPTPAQAHARLGRAFRTRR